MSFISELKRRNVIRMAGLYLVAAWLITQVAATLLPVFEAPSWVMKTIVGILVLGFIPALVFAWVFELTPNGLKRDSDVPAEHSITSQIARRMEHTIVVLLTIALAFFGFDKFVLAPKREAAAVAAAVQNSKSGTVSATITDKSIAVLPFVDMSQAKDQEWFGDGLAEEILNALVKTPDLQVSARTSSFKYKGSNLAVPQIAEELGVAHVLEGSIRSTATRIRVTAQLIRASDGFHLWSQTYDREPADMIAIQEDLALSIATVMQTTMDPQALSEMTDVGTRSVEAYQAFLHGKASGLLDSRDAYDYFEMARTIDPEFSYAHVEAANYWAKQLSITQFGSSRENLSRQEKQNQYRERIQRAIETAKTPFAKAFTEASAASVELRWRDGIANFLSVQKQRPENLDIANNLLNLGILVSDRQLMQQQLEILWSQAMDDISAAMNYANTAYRAGDYRLSADRVLLIAQRWPNDFMIQYQVHRTLLWDRRVDVAARILAKLRQLPEGENTDAVLLASSRQACAEGKRSEVEKVSEGFTGHQNTRWHLLMMLNRQSEATELLRAFDRDDNAYALSEFLYYPNFDPTPYPSLMQILERENVKRAPPVPLPFACPPASGGSAK